MKNSLKLLSAAALAVMLCGCMSMQKEKLPAGDIDIYKNFANEIDILHNPKLRSNSKEKYEAALTLYRNIDFSYVRDIQTLEKIFGAHDAHHSQRDFEIQNIIFLYRYKGKRVRFVFTRYNNAITHSECTDKIY